MQYYNIGDNEFKIVYLPQLRSLTNDGLPMFGLPSYTNTMGREDNTFMRDNYMPDMRGMDTRESSGIKANTELPKPPEPRVDPTPRMSDFNDERKHDYDFTQRVRTIYVLETGDRYDHIATFRQVVRAE